MTPTAQKRSNSERPKSLKLEEIAKLVGGILAGDGQLPITGVSGIKDAQAGDITFLANPKYSAYLDDTRASAVIVSPEVVSSKKALVRISNPSEAFTKVATFFAIERSQKSPGVHPTAVIDKSARLGKDVFIGPHVVIENDVEIGDRVVIEANSFIGEKSVIDDESKIHPNVTLYPGTEIGKRAVIHSGSVIGSDGFGYEAVNGKQVKIPQTGTVVIEDDVEIGSNVSIDRARFGKTWIKQGVKIDNLVQIAHNVEIGENTVIVSQSGISGSTILGKNVVIAGQAGLVGHLVVGDGAVVGAGSGVTKSVPPDTVVLGGPARPIQEQRKIYVLIGKLPDLFKDVSDLKKKLEAK